MEQQELLRHRIIFLGEPVSGASANRIVAQLLLLDAEDHVARIDFYINSSGGSVTEGTSIIDAMCCIQAPVSTICIGCAASTAAILLAAGEKGCRFSTPNAEVMIHQVSGSAFGQASDLEVHARHLLRVQENMVRMLADWTGQSTEQIRRDTEREYYMTAMEARAYGIVDEVLEPFRP